MRVEDELKALILERFKSVRAFASAVGFPYSTINNIFMRGVGGAGLSTIIPLCRALNLDVDALADEQIKFKSSDTEKLLPDESRLLDIYRGFNDSGKEVALERILEMSQLPQYKKCDKFDTAPKEA